MFWIKCKNCSKIVDEYEDTYVDGEDCCSPCLLLDNSTKDGGNLSSHQAEKRDRG